MDGQENNSFLLLTSDLSQNQIQFFPYICFIIFNFFTHLVSSFNFGRNPYCWTQFVNDILEGLHYFYTNGFGNLKKDKMQFTTLFLKGYTSVSVMSSAAALALNYNLIWKKISGKVEVFYSETKTNTVPCHCCQVLLNRDYVQQKVKINDVIKKHLTRNYSSPNFLFVKCVSTAFEYLFMHVIGKNLQIYYLLRISPVSKIQFYESFQESSVPPAPAPPPLKFDEKVEMKQYLNEPPGGHSA